MLLSKVKGIPFPSELRPITLLQCDYKLLTRLLFKKINPVLPSVLSAQQLCVPGRDIMSGAMGLVSTIIHAKAHKLEAAIVSIDLRKAYDRVSIPFLVQVLTKMEFPNKIIQWILMIHRGNQARFLLDTPSKLVSIVFSVRQGDPIAMLLFLLYVEPLFRMLNIELPGISLGSARITGFSYVDDNNSIVTDISHIHLIRPIFHRFGRLSGASPNLAKSYILGIGAWAGRMNWPINWLKPVMELRVFGVNLSAKYTTILVSSWTQICNGIKSAWSWWGQRCLPTLAVRVRVLSIFVLSKLSYLAQILPITKTAIKVIEAFTWKAMKAGNLELVLKRTLWLPVEKGGVGLPNVRLRANALLSKSLLKGLAGDRGPIIQQILHFWLGLRLHTILPDDIGPRTMLCHNFMNTLVTRVREIVPVIYSPDEMTAATAKFIYSQKVQDLLPPTIETKIDLSVTAGGWELVWTRLADPIFDLSARDI